MPIDSLVLEGRTAVVTGGARGLGKAMAGALARAGASIALVDRDVQAALATAAALAQDGHECEAVEADVSDQASINQMVDCVVKRWGRIDVLVNNAGIGHNAPAESMKKEDWDRVIAVNLTGVFLCSQRVGREMIRLGRGAIVNVSSMSSLIVNYPQPQIAYNASKAGVNMVTKSLASEWAQYGIRVNAIAPGYMKTELTRPFFEDPVLQQQWNAQENWIQRTPLNRAGLPEELGEAVVFLASDASAFMTGHVLVIDGGYSIR